MERFEDIKTNRLSKTHILHEATLVKSEAVQSAINKSEEETSNCPPRRNGLFSITENLKVHRHLSPGRWKLEINVLLFFTSLFVWQRVNIFIIFKLTQALSR